MHVLSENMHHESTLSDEVIVNLAQLSYTNLVSFVLIIPFSWNLFLSVLLGHFMLGFVFVCKSVFVCSLYVYSPFFFFSLLLLSVTLVKSKLDPENLGIILLGPFLLEFFPDQVCVRVCMCAWRWRSTTTSTIQPLHDKCLPSVIQSISQLKHMEQDLCPKTYRWHLGLFSKNMWSAALALCQ